MDTHPAPTAPADTAPRLKALRAALAREGLDGFVVPRADEHQGEYVPACAQRLAWLTGFTGSAGMAVVLADRAAVFVDGRYTLQVASEVDTSAFQPLHLIDTPPHVWLAETLTAGQRLGFDPWLHTVEGVERLKAACRRAGATLVAVAANPVDAVWTDRPPPPLAPVVPHALAYAGKSADTKRAELAGQLAADHLDAAVLTAPDSIAWLLNIRGDDVPYSPLPLGFAVLHGDGRVNLFLDPRKSSPDLAAWLGDGVTLAAPQALGPALDALGAARRRVRLDSASAAAWVAERLTAAGATLDPGLDPCALPRACKNAVELDGARRAHRRDGAALVRFLAWIKAEALVRPVGEIEASDRLEAFRRQGELFRDLSFPTISGAGPNGAIVHYRAQPATERAIRPGMLYLVDSGAQYLDGTTDVTRTLAVGAVGAEEKRRFTRVLQGHVALAAARFPPGTTGSQLDVLARLPLWRDGLDYDHGTGHGVGSYLGVHEGPQRISKSPSTVALKPGMVLSDEPGYYQAGAYGIRLENLVAVCAEPSGGRGWLGFETLTLAPFDRDAIAVELLSAEDIAWVNGYHARVNLALAPLLDPATAAWLAWATAPL